MDTLFSDPLRSTFGLKILPILYTETWGDYWGYFVFYAREKQNGRYIEGLYADSNRISPEKVVSGELRFETNRYNINSYLGRVNAVSIVPSCLFLAGFLIGLTTLWQSVRNKLQDEGRDTVDANLELGFPADARHYAVEAQMLHDLKVSSVRLMTNNPNKIHSLKDLGVEVIAREPLVAGLNGDNKAYMAAKVDRLGHLVENVLAVSRLERRRTNETELVSPGSMLERMESRLRERTNRAGLELHISREHRPDESTDSPTGDPSEEPQINVNLFAVERIVMNLVDNACKYAGPASTTPDVRVSTQLPIDRWISYIDRIAF